MKLATIPVDRMQVAMAFRYLLGREPESDAAIQAHLGLGNVDALRRAIMASKEFQSRSLTRRHQQPKWVCTEVLDGYTMWVDLQDRYVSYGCLQNSWEPEETGFFEACLRAGDTVLDIGANVGWYSLVAARSVGMHGVIHAFEPRPETACMLHRTVAGNGLKDRIRIWEVALDDQPGERLLSWEPESANPGHSYLDGRHPDPGAPPTASSARVRAARLDELLPDVAPDIVKIDVEGAEPRVIAGAARALARRRPIVLSELFPEQLASVSGTSAAGYIQQMESLGYACFLLEGGKPSRRLADFPPDAKRELVSVVFEPSGSHHS